MPRKINVSFSSAKRKLAEKMNGICQVRSRMLPYTSQTAEEAVTFHLPFFSYLI